jgi:hypothetical protein
MRLYFHRVRSFDRDWRRGPIVTDRYKILFSIHHQVQSPWRVNRIHHASGHATGSF